MSDVGEPGPEPEEELPPEPVWPVDGVAPELDLPTGDEDVPGWGCVLGVLFLIVLIVVGTGACTGLFDGDDDPPATTTAEQ
mgnify:CR=1 FL=1